MIFLRLSNFHILFVFGILLYSLSILAFNVDRGFDVTDESHYILGAINPFDVFSVITHVNYYTGILFYLSNYNLYILRLLGIIILLLSSLWFALELYRYIEKEFNLDYSICNKIYFVLVIVISSESYYLWWLITPSYNWLSVVAMILIMGSIFRAINRANEIKGKLFCMEYIYIGSSLSLLFMAKIVSLLALFPIFIIFVVVNYKKIDLLRAVFSIFIIFLTLILLHIIFLDGGFSSYIYRLKESIERLFLLGGGHSLDKIFLTMGETGRDIYFRINKSQLVIFILFSLFITRYFYVNKKILPILCYIFIFCLAYIFYFPVIIPFNPAEKFYITILIFSMFIVSIYFFTEQKIKEKFKIYLQAFFLFIFLSYISIAISFGTSNIIWFHVNISYLFPVAGILSFIFIFDRYHSLIKNIKIIVGITISLSVLIILNNAYENPYRLNTSIKEQTEKVNILGGLKVDNDQKIYIDDLIKAKSYIKNTDEQIYLIDTTGATPGVNVILGAKFFQQPWLLGGYSGSNEFFYKILSNVSSEKLKKGWILTTTNGLQVLDLNLLNKLSLDFPENYDRIATLFLKSRNETQELWKPKDNLNKKSE